MRIGFYGGCFNPTSNIHVNLAKIIINKFKLDKMVFVPVGDYYEKNGLISALDRYSMLKLAIENEEKMEIEELAIQSKIKLYAADTFKLLKEKYNKDELFFVMGSDNFRKMPNWKNYDELVNCYNIIVIERERKHIRKTDRKNILEFIPDKVEEVDSSKIRQMISNNEDASGYLNNKVYSFIKEKGLYKSQEK